MRRSLPFLLASIFLRVASPAAAGELVVSAAASLTDGVREVVAVFEADHSGDTVVCNFAASGTLLRQLERGAPVDVFLTADRATMDRAQAAGVIKPKTRAVFAGNVLTLVATPELVARGFHPEDLTAWDEMLLAVGNPKYVPAGRYALQALGPALWQQLEGRLVLGNSVRQVLDYVSRGEVDVGVVYGTDAAAAAGRVRAVGPLPGHDPIRYRAAVAAASGNQALATRFVEFLCGERGQAILARHGFTPPPAAPEAPVVAPETAQARRMAWTSR